MQLEYVTGSFFNLALKEKGRKNMRIIENRIFFKNYYRHTEHIESFDFNIIPREIKKITGSDFEIIKELPFIRDEENKKLLINEGIDGFDDFIKIFVALDNLPTVILQDLYELYNPKMKNVTIENAYTVLSETETSKRVLFCLIPEILWANGNDKIKSRIF